MARPPVLTGIHFMSGNIAVAEGSIAAGCRFYAGYPITPSSEVFERFAERMPEVGGICIQMEDEMGSIAAVLGASWAGLKAMTATSGPGFSLMQEHVSYAVMTETPCVIVNVQRGSPATGLPTLPGQGDVMQAKWGAHGSYEIIALSPNSPQECFDMAIRAFNLSEQYRVPAIILMDECIGHMYEKVVIPPKDQIKIVNRKKPEKGKPYLPYKADDDLIPPMAAAGDGFKFHITGLTHDERGYPDLSAEAHEKIIKRICDKIRLNTHKIVDYETFRMEDAEIIVISFGAASRSAFKAVELAREDGIKAGLLRLKTIWPFPCDYIGKLAEKVKAFVVAEVNYGQLVHEVERCALGKADVILSAVMGGRIHRPEEILDKIMEAVK